jgi:hypothetical protein
VTILTGFLDSGKTWGLPLRRKVVIEDSAEAIAGLANDEAGRIHAQWLDHTTHRNALLETLISGAPRADL